LSFYDTSPLRQTLQELIDFDLLNSGAVRLSIGAAHLLRGDSVYFDTQDKDYRLGPEHIMASAALPPGFPPIEIDGEHFWDGGVLSNTPLDTPSATRACWCSRSTFSARAAPCRATCLTSTSDTRTFFTLRARARIPTPSVRRRSCDTRSEGGAPTSQRKKSTSPTAWGSGESKSRAKGSSQAPP